jgi:hypothetical protein
MIIFAVQRHTLTFFKKSWQFLEEYHINSEEEWTFTQAHFDSGIFRKITSDLAMLDALQNCVKKKKSAGFYTIQGINTNLFKRCLSQIL